MFIISCCVLVWGLGLIIIKQDKMSLCKSSYLIARYIIAAVIIFASIFTSGCHKSNPVAVNSGK